MLLHAIAEERLKREFYNAPHVKAASREVEPPLRVVPFTIHIPLAEVMKHLDARAIAATGAVPAADAARQPLALSSSTSTSAGSSFNRRQEVW